MALRSKSPMLVTTGLVVCGELYCDDMRRAALRVPDPLTALEQTVAEGLQLQADMLAALPRDADGPTAGRRLWALAPAFDVLLQLMPVLKALGSPQGALQASVASQAAEGTIVLAA